MIKTRLNTKSNLLLVTFILLTKFILSAQPGIHGQIKLDTTKWSPIAYLSIIPEFSQLNTISYENIIERTEISKDGTFSFNSDFLSSNDRFYRLHISKIDDPPASLIIGGKDHNHFFLIANRNSEIKIQSGRDERLFNNLTINGYQPNEALMEINSIIGLLDTLDYFGSSINRDFIRNAVHDRIKKYADTCSHPLVSSYALYKIGYEPTKKSDWMILWIIVVLILLTISIVWYVFRSKQQSKKNPLSDLTIQERKIFALLKEGKSNKEIADECAISISTVKSHVNNIYSKLGVGSRKEIMDIGPGSSPG